MVFDLTDYKLLSFDIYATLIDWETGIYEALTPLINQLPSTSQHLGATPDETRKLILQAFSSHEHALQVEQPKLHYDLLLAEIYQRLASHLGVTASAAAAQAFGASLGAYPPFADTIAAMRVLGSHYKLVALSNVDNASFGATLSGPLQGQVAFDAVYTAQDIGSYKPDLANFRYLIAHAAEGFGVRQGEILHTAQSLTHDHVPAKEIGLAPGVWIRRGRGSGSVLGGGGGEEEGLEREGKVVLGAVYETLGEMAAAVEEAFAGRNEVGC